MGRTEASAASSDAPGNSAAVSASAQQDNAEQSTHIATLMIDFILIRSNGNIHATVLRTPVSVGR